MINRDVDIEALSAALEYINRVNSIPLEDIRWTSKGQLVRVEGNDINEWKYTGLNNTTFYQIYIQPVYGET